MDFQTFIKKASATPYELKGESFSGMDCFGFVQLWYKYILNIEIQDRKMQSSDPKGFQEGYKAQKQWVKLEKPLDNSVVVMRSLWDRKVIPFGHCGMFYDNNVYHIEENGGFQVVPFTDKRLQSRITDIRIHNKAV